MNEWQPIETAPKDGRTLLFFDGFEFVFGWWDKEDEEWRAQSHDTFYVNHPSHWLLLEKPK